MLQCLGCILVVFATTSFGVSFVMKEKFRLQDLKEVETGILLLQNQVRYIGAPLGEVMEGIGLKLNGMVGEIFARIGSDLESRKGESGSVIWERIWMEEGRYTYLTGIDLDEIISFGKTISFLERTGQENGLDLLLISIRTIENDLQSKMSKNQKLYGSLGVLSGLLLVVTLL
ncbi:stage III sporulation protein AB [Chakrabartyella piscis]|uniref:stage III sporulation protein AB n=1 Tax=Chakrabartyella piscis TaxID=2918914 RepID=UPI0029587E3D|nr:stage III sporulation protein AB [Chakrabartyella piscis]